MIAGTGLVTAACSSPSEPTSVDFLRGFYGGAVADEPTAASIGRDVLDAGGSAGDAAVAMYFALAVTKPASAGLGAVGACLVYEPGEKAVRALDFTSPPAGSGSVAIPGAVRGMYAVHAMLGRQPWSQLLGPAERLARFGTSATRSFVGDLEARPDVAGDQEFGRIVAAGGSLVGEGDRVVQPALAEFISGIRVSGPAAFYAGPLGERFAEAVARMGERLDFAEMRTHAPNLGEPLTRPAGHAEAYFLPSDHTAGPWQAARWGGPEGREHDGSAVATPFAHSGTSFAVADGRGNAVACGLTLNRPFGIGRTAPGTGIFPAAPVAQGSISGALSPVIVANHYTDILLLAASGSGAGAPEEVVNVGFDATVERVPLNEAFGRASSALVNVVSCPDGLPSQSHSCRMAADPRGAGYAAASLPREGRP